MTLVITLAILVIAVAVGFLVVANLRTVARIKRERHSDRQPEEQANIFISMRATHKLHHALSEEESQILWLDRRHWLTASRIILLVLLGTVSLVMTIVVSAWPPGFTFPAIGNSPEHHTTLTYLWILPALIAAAATLTAWTFWLKWSADYRLLTDKRLVLITQPWEWAFWLWNTEKSDPLPLQAVTAVETKNTYWGRIFGYGSVIVKSLLQDTEDEEFHEITFTRRNRELKEAIDRAVNDSKIHLVSVGTSIVPVEDAAKT